MKNYATSIFTHLPAPEFTLMNKHLLYFLLIPAILILNTHFSLAANHSPEPPGAKDRCAVCGMFVAKYPQWLTLLVMENGDKFWFDGVKDMMAFYFTPNAFGAAKGVKIKQVLVKDYYSQFYIDGRQAWYVVGSDVYGPMGHELIPFSSEKAAKNFTKDHHGKEIRTFGEITSEKIEAMRKGHKMNKMHGSN